MGHSMGGAGTIYLGVKHASIWAAIAPIAPASGGLLPDNYSLAPAKGTFHESLLACLGACFREVPELAADAQRQARLKKSGGCCP